MKLSAKIKTYYVLVANLSGLSEYVCRKSKVDCGEGGNDFIWEDKENDWCFDMNNELVEGWNIQSGFIQYISKNKKDIEAVRETLVNFIELLKNNILFCSKNP